MIVVICGGRTYWGTPEDLETLDRLRIELPITKVLSGGAKGGDALGELWARKHGIELEIFPANWAKLGRSAGMIRNGEMAKFAQAIIAFPGGRGTDDMTKRGLNRGLRVIRINGKICEELTVVSRSI